MANKNKKTNWMHAEAGSSSVTEHKEPDSFKTNSQSESENVLNSESGSKGGVVAVLTEEQKEFNKFNESFYKDAPISIPSWLNFGEISKYVKTIKEIDEKC